MSHFAFDMQKKYKSDSMMHLSRYLLKDIKKYYDYIIIDTAPSTDIATQNAIVASDFTNSNEFTIKYCDIAIKTFIQLGYKLKDKTEISEFIKKFQEKVKKLKFRLGDNPKNITKINEIF